MTAGTASIRTAIFATIRQTERRKNFLFVRWLKLDRKEKNSYLSKFGQKGKKLLFVRGQTRYPPTGGICSHICMCWYPLTRGLRARPLSKREPTYTCGGKVDRKREKEKMKEELERLFRDWCFEQNIDENDSISMQDISDFFDYVEMMTDLFEV